MGGSYVSKIDKEPEAPEAVSDDSAFVMTIAEPEKEIKAREVDHEPALKAMYEKGAQDMRQWMTDRENERKRNEEALEELLSVSEVLSLARTNKVELRDEKLTKHMESAVNELQEARNASKLPETERFSRLIACVRGGEASVEECKKAYDEDDDK